jgi:uncharacterized protein YerC
MQLSKKKVNKNLERQVYSLLFQVVADIKNPDEARVFLESFLSKNELEVISRRLGIAYFLDKGKSYANIKDNLAVSSTTIAAVAKEMQNKKGFKIALGKIRAEEWANKWTKRLSKMIKIRRK